MTKIISRTVPICQIDDCLKRSMYVLFERYYSTTNYEQFCHDLAEKDEVFLFSHGEELIGFSTIFKKLAPKGILIFSGDTVIKHEFWGQKFLQRQFFWYILNAKLFSLGRPVYWMLISKGFKTYLMMRRNFRHSFPNWKHEIPAEMKQVMDAFYSEKFGKEYVSELSQIFPKLNTAVKEGIARPSGPHLNDPEVQYYLKRNPNFEKGVELACIAEIRIQDFLLHIPKFFLPKLSPRRREPATQAVHEGS